jgi:hypothetical protein
MSGTLDFTEMAKIAASKVQMLNPAEALAESFTNDRPAIDSAVKSFMSLTAARIWSTSDPNVRVMMGEGNHLMHKQIRGEGNEEKCFFVQSDSPKHAALKCARALLGKINQFRVPDSCTMEEEKSEELKMEKEVVRILWNGLVESGDKDKKPSKLLGRMCLSHVIPWLENDLLSMTVPGVDDDEAKIFMKEFISLLRRANYRNDPHLSQDDRSKLNLLDDDSCLLWDKDCGNAELSRRRQRRETKARTEIEIIDESSIDDLK